MLAKACAIAIWGLVISGWVLALGLAIGALIGLPGWSESDPGTTVTAIALAAVLTLTLQTGAAFFAGVGRGYIAPLAWTVAMIVVSQVLTVLGWGAWFPWSVPALIAGAGGTSVEPVSPAGVIVVVGVAAAGLVATVVWWERADQSG